MAGGILLLVVEGGPALAGREKLPQTARDGRWYQLFDISAKGGNLLYPTGRDEADLGAGHHVDGLDIGGQRPVQLVHLELIFEVGDHPQALHDHLRVPAAGEVDHELLEDLDLDVVEM